MKAATYVGSSKTHATEDGKHTLCGLPVWKVKVMNAFFNDRQRCLSCQNVVVARLEKEGIRV